LAAQGLPLEAGMVITVDQLVYHCAKTADEQKAYQCVHGTVMDPGNSDFKATPGYFYLTYKGVDRVELRSAPKIIVNIEHNKTTIGTASLVEGKLVGYSDHLEPEVQPQPQPAGDIPKHIWVSQTVQSFFAPPSDGNEATAYVDGADAMEAMAEAMMAAKKSIYITGWWISPDIIMSEKGKRSLKDILDTKAAEAPSVPTSILLYTSGLPDLLSGLHLGEHEAEIILERDFPAHIHVILASASSSVLTHHQKTVVVDEQCAFLGGVDLAQGRRDTHEHRLDPFSTDEQNYYNPQIDKANRDQDIRMPWHDIHVKLIGASAKDVARNFVRRWNSSLIQERVRAESALESARKPGKQTPIVKGSNIWNMIYYPAKELAEPGGINALTNGTCTVQIARSIGPKSGSGSLVVERGIEEMYVKLITEAKSYIHIEQQFFTSLRKDGNADLNKVVPAICDRLDKAILEGDPFRVYIVIPQYPEGVLSPKGFWNAINIWPAKESWRVQELMHWQYQTIIRGKNKEEKIGKDSLYGRAMKSVRTRNKDPNMTDDACMAVLDRYIKFFNLVRCEVINRAGPPPTATLSYSQIYVHAKAMIVDDLYVVIGTANINDRGMLGDRDTEIAALIVDTDREDSKMAGQPFQARKFARKLRMNLWKEHLGLPESPETETLLADPLSEQLHDHIKDVATANTALLKRMFPGFPRDEFLTLGQQRKGEEGPPVDEAEREKLRGHLTLFPLHWLEDEDLETTGLPDWLMSFNNSDDMEGLNKQYELKIEASEPTVIG
jgi:phospholipase D1/2